MSHPGKVDRKGLVAHARALGLELKRFEQALDSGRLEPQLEVDLREADWLGLDGALSYGATFVNGRKMRDPASITELRKILDVRLRKAGAGR